MSDDQSKFLVEYMDSALARIGEILAPIKDDVAEIKGKVNEIDDIKQEIITMKKAITETNEELREFKEDTEKQLRILDESIGNIDHKMHYIETIFHDDHKKVKAHNERIKKLEHKIA